MSDWDVKCWYALGHRQSDGRIFFHPRLYRRAIISFAYIAGFVTLVEAREAIKFEQALLACAEIRVRGAVE